MSVILTSSSLRLDGVSTSLTHGKNDEEQQGCLNEQRKSFRALANKQLLPKARIPFSSPSPWNVCLLVLLF